MTVAVILGAGSCLVWFVTATAAAVPGLRRWRWGTPGGRRAVASAAAGSVFPILCSAFCAAAAIWPNTAPAWLETLWEDAAAALALFGAACSVLSLGLLSAAGRAATAAAARARRPPGPSPLDPNRTEPWTN